MQGIYQIKSLTTNKIYIGKSVELQKRFQKHLNPLRKKKHYNVHLQRHFNKYGESDFEYSVLEETNGLNAKELSDKEVYWIKLNGANGNGNFNQTKGGETGAGVNRNIEVKLKNIISGEIRCFESRNEAGRQLNISPSDIRRLLKGERVKRLGEWTKIDCDYSKVLRHGQKSFTLYHDQYGKITECNMAAFAKKIGVVPQVINNLIKGMFYNCRGWRLTKEKYSRKRNVIGQFINSII